MLPSMTASQQFVLTFLPTTQRGKPALIDGDPVWASSNEAAASVVPIPGTLTATVIAQAPGDYSISAAGDGDLGAGVVTITAVDSGTVTADPATSATLGAGPVTDQP